MRKSFRTLALLAVMALLLSCERTATEVSQSTFEVKLRTVSQFVDQGHYLIGDVVRFEATVTENGRPFAASGPQFRSSDPSVVRISNATTGEAEFLTEGMARVTVSFAEPNLEGADSLTASMNIRVTRFTVELSLSSTQTGSDVNPGDALLGDEVRVNATVRKDGTEVASSGVTVESATPPDLVDLTVGGSDVLKLIGSGTTTLIVAVDKPDIPGSDPLRQAIQVTIKDFAVQLNLTSLVAGSSHLVQGDTMVTDSVQFSATVIKDGAPITTSGPSWTSSNASIVRFVDAVAGVAVFDDTGSANVSVTFADPPLPGQPGNVDLRVTTFVAEGTVTSRLTSDLANGDTLKTDSVTFGASVEKDGQVRPSSIAQVSSSSASIIEILDPGNGTAFFADTGTATVTVALATPRLPRQTLQATLSPRITTYVAALSGPTPADPIMGDTLQYTVQVTDTRDGSTVSNPTVSYSSSAPTVIQLLDAASGRAFARDTGRATVSVTVSSPSLPAGVVSDSRPPKDIIEERFYGAFSDSSGTFGLTAKGDTVIVEASSVHKFTDSTRVQFPNGAFGFVNSVKLDTLIFLVPAGADTGRLVFRNLRDDNFGFRDNVSSRFDFNGPGTAAVNDFYEPNDTMPLTTSQFIQTFPFDALLASDPNKTAPADTNFFYFEVLTPSKTFDIRAEWQVDADLDFKVCNAIGNPPTDYDPALCPRPPAANGSDPRVEEALGLTLSTNRFVIGFYCVSCPSTLPLTYKVTIVERP